MSATRADPMIFVEHLTFNQRVMGSSPIALTIFSKGFPAIDPSGDALLYLSGETGPHSGWGQ